MPAIILGIICGLLVCCDCFLIFHIKENLKEEQKIKEAVNQQNDNLQQLTKNCDDLCAQQDDILEYKKYLDSQVLSAKEEYNTLKKEYDTLQEYCKHADQEYHMKLSLMESSQKTKEQELIQKYNTLCEEQEERLGEVSRDFLLEWRKTSEKLLNDKNALAAQIEEERATLNAAIDAAKRAQLEQIKKDYYKIMLDAVAQEDIEHLRSIEPLLARPESLNKIIWKVYYEKPVSDMIGRVVGDTTKTGIYKITHCASEMAYVGQAVDIASRWRQHIKRGLGAETPTQNKLYPAMKKFGPEAFMFEILEECDRNKLDEREDYWQDFYRVKEFGYSIK